MKSIRRALAVVALLVVTAVSAYADHPVTLVLKSGERLAGQFTDLHDDLVYVRSNRNQERRVPLSDIAVVDFTNDRTAVDDDAALRRNGATEHLLVLRNGRRIAGRFEGLTGDDQPHSEGHPLEFVFSTASGEYVRVNADRIARLYLAEPRAIDDTTSGGVTVWMNDGTSMRGALTALDARAFALDTMRGAMSRRTLDDVAMIDFEGRGRRSAEDGRFESRDASAPDLLVMRDGRRLSGEFIGQARQTRGGEQTYMFRSSNRRIASFSPSTASRLYLGRGESAITSQEGDAGFGSRPSMVVSAREAWTPTGVTVRRGDLITFQARGEVQLSADNNDRARPSGSYSNRLAPSAPLRQAPAGALIGRVGGTVFLIGDGQNGIRMPASGELFLGVNDDHFPDNQGSYEVVVRAARSSSN